MIRDSQLTITSIGSIIVFSYLFALFLALVLRNNKLLSKVKYEVLLVCMTAPVMKILIPMEILPFTQNINIPYVLPQIVIFFKKTVLTVGTRAFSLWDMILMILLTTSTLNMLRTAISYRYFLLDKMRAPKVEEPEVYRLIDKILSEKGKKVSVTVRWAKEGETPIVFGLFKPTILLSRIKLSEAELECVLRHEIAHYLHGDLIMRFVWILIKSFCYWNPAVYILDKQFENLLEIRADENATKGKELEYRKQYMKTIVKLSAENPEAISTYSAAFYKSEGLTVRKRIDIIHYRTKRKIADFIGANVLTSIAIIVLAVAMNCLIFEPRGAVPDVGPGNIDEVQAVTNNNSFFIKNAEGTYDMYWDGVYRATLETTRGSDIKVYESLEEALKYEEIK